MRPTAHLMRRGGRLPLPCAWPLVVMFPAVSRDGKISVSPVSISPSLRALESETLENVQWDTDREAGAEVPGDARRALIALPM